MGVLGMSVWAMGALDIGVLGILLCGMALSVEKEPALADAYPGTAAAGAVPVDAVPACCA